MGLAALSIFRGVTSGRFPNIPPPPPGFSLIAAATGPVASDLLPLFLQASSPTDPAFIQSVTLTLVRNAGLIFAIVTISGRAASLIWQGGIDFVKYVFVLIHGKHGLKENRSIVDRPVLKTAIVLLMLLPIFGVSHYGITSPPFQAAVPGPYQQRLDIALGMLGAPNTTLQLTNLDLSSKGLVQDNNYAGANVAAFIVNNNDSQALGNGQQNQMLQTLSQPALVTVYSGDPKTTASESAAVEAQFSKRGAHQLDLKTLLGFQNNIVGDPAANASLISMSFQPGTILYSPLFPNPLYNNATSTYYLDVTSSSQPDFIASFNYPFAPDIVIQKTSTPNIGPVGTTHIIVVTVQNLDNVTVTNLNLTDPQNPSSYAQTLPSPPSRAQTS